MNEKEKAAEPDVSLDMTVAVGPVGMQWLKRLLV